MKNIFKKVKLLYASDTHDSGMPGTEIKEVSPKPTKNPNTTLGANKTASQELKKTTQESPQSSSGLGNVQTQERKMGEPSTGIPPRKIGERFNAPGERVMGEGREHVNDGNLNVGEKKAHSEPQIHPNNNHIPKKEAFSQENKPEKSYEHPRQTNIQKNEQSASRLKIEAQWKKTTSGAPRVRQNIDTGSTVVVDGEGKKISGIRKSESEQAIKQTPKREDSKNITHSEPETPKKPNPKSEKIKDINTPANTSDKKPSLPFYTQEKNITFSEAEKKSGKFKSPDGQEWKVPENSDGVTWKGGTQGSMLSWKDEESQSTSTHNSDQKKETQTATPSQPNDKNIPPITLQKNGNPVNDTLVDTLQGTKNEKIRHIPSANKVVEELKKEPGPDGKDAYGNTVKRGENGKPGTDKKDDVGNNDKKTNTTNFEAAGDIDAETKARDEYELKKYQAEQAKKTPEEKKQEAKEARELFDMGRGDTSGVTAVTGERAKKYKNDENSNSETSVTTPKKPNPIVKTNTNEGQNKNFGQDRDTVQGPVPEIDASKKLPPLGGNMAQGVKVSKVDDGVSQAPVQGEGSTIYQPVHLSPTEKHPEGEKGRISYTPPEKNITGAYNPFAGEDRLKKEEKQEGWKSWTGPKEWRDGADREVQMKQSFGEKGTQLLNKNEAQHQTAALSKGDGMIINGSPHPDLGKRREQAKNRRIAEGRPTPNSNPDGTKLDDNISTFDFGATIGSRHAVVNNSTGEVWRSRQDKREGKPPVAIQINRGYVNRVDSGGSQSAPNSDQLLELRAPNPYNIPFSTENHRVFVANGTIYAGNAIADKNGQIITRRIGRYNADSGEVVIDQKDPAFIEWRRKMENDKPILKKMGDNFLP